MISSYRSPTYNPTATYLIGGVILTGLYATSLYNYLLFHCLAEIFSILVSFSIFMFAWNTLGFVQNHYIILLGVAYLFSGVFDLLHTLSYKGMGILGDGDPNLPTQLWIIARYVESISLLAAPLVFNRRLNAAVILTIYTLGSVLLLGSLFPYNLFPDCYIDGVGLTPFKKISEYAICGILVTAGVQLYLRRRIIGKVVYTLLAVSIGFTIAGELVFTFYISVYGISNMLGHLLKIISFYLVYRAIVVYGLLAPYKTMFRELNNSKLALERYSQELESMVAGRTQSLENRNEELRALSNQLLIAEETERKRIARELHDGIGQSLSAIKLFTENAITVLSGRLSAPDLKPVQQLVPMVITAIEEMRRMIKNLRPSVLDDLGILAAIRSQCREFEAAYSKTVIEQDLQVSEKEVPPAVKSVILRLLQEGLNNIAKHSSARFVRVSLTQCSERIVFEVHDDGCGFDLKGLTEKFSTYNGFGLTSMRERTELSGARFIISTQPGKGTKIHAAWPVSA
jgi:signal transduction histidine kinase